MARIERNLHAAMLHARETDVFFSGIRRRLDDLQHDRRRAMTHLFAEISPRLASARRLSRQLDRRLARRFNVFDYLRTDELGLSRVIADLLNPRASHGQGVLFLRRFLRLLPQSPSLQSLAALDPVQVSVSLEHAIKDQRRIDILVEISDRQSTFALAFENKPYADDQKHQVRDYLRYLHGRCGRSFLLIYLSPRGEGPSDWSVSSRSLRECWEENFAILPYHRHDSSAESDDFDTFRLSFSLIDWLQTCRSDCEVERLRWFLGDAIQFCRTTFGGHTMTSKRESQAIRDFLFEHPEHFETALAVLESWTAIRDEICKEFLERLVDCIRNDEQLLKHAPDLQVGCVYGGNKAYSNKLWLYRNEWHSYKDGGQMTSQRTAIVIESQGRGPNRWCVGVRSPLPKGQMATVDKERRERMEPMLKQKLSLSKTGSQWWPIWDYLDATIGDWDSRLADLHRENKREQAGKFANDIVSEIVKVAAAAIPVIDKFDR